MLDPRPRHRLPTAHPSSRCCGHMHLFKVEIWNQASTLGEVPSPKLTGQVNLLTSHKEGRSVSPHLETFLLQVPCRVFFKKCMLYKLTVSNDCYIQEFDNNLFLFLPEESHGRRSLVGCSPWGRTESDTAEATQQQQQQQQQQHGSDKSSPF